MFSSERGKTSHPSGSSAVREAWLRTVFESAPVGLGVATPDGNWLLVNDTCCQILGYTREELLRFSLNDLTHRDDLPRELALLAPLLAGQQRQYRIEKRVMSKRGDFRSLLVTVTLIASAHGDVLIYVVEPPHAAAATGNGAGHLALMVLDQLADVAVVRTDPTGIITGWNEGAERILGHRREEIVGKNRDILYHDREAWPDRAGAHLRAAALHGGHDSDDFRVTRGGAPVPVHSHLYPNGSGEAIRGFVEVLSPHFQQIIEEARRERDAALRTQKTLFDENVTLKRDARRHAAEMRALARTLRDERDRRRSAERRVRQEPAASWSSIEHGDPLELLLAAAEARRTGALIVARDDEHKAFFFENGWLTGAASDDPRQFLAELLVRDGAITDEQRSAALQHSDRGPAAFGRCVVSEGAASAGAVADALREKIEREAEAIASWPGGSWTFVDRKPLPREHLPLFVDVHDLRAAHGGDTPQPAVA